jgi:hypothetical protein
MRKSQLKEYYLSIVEKYPSFEKESLKEFMRETLRVLQDFCTEGALNKIFGSNYQLIKLAENTFSEDVIPAIEKTIESIGEIRDDILDYHGLRFRAAEFKYRALIHNVRKWEATIKRNRGMITIGKTFRSAFEAIDVILDSLIDAVGTGLGGLVKEFKDMLMASAVVKTYK